MWAGQTGRLQRCGQSDIEPISTRISCIRLALLNALLNIIIKLVKKPVKITGSNIVNRKISLFSQIFKAVATIRGIGKI